MAEDNKQENKPANSKQDNSFWHKLGIKGIEPKKLMPLALVLVLGCVLMWVSGLNADSKAKNTSIENTGNNGEVVATTAPAETKTTSEGSDGLRGEESILEAKLVKILSKIQGVGAVDVSLTFAQGNKAEYAVNASTTMRSTEEADSNGGTKTTTETTENGEIVLEKSSNSPVLIQETNAKIQGVLVVADGGGDPQVCTRIIDAVAGLLDVPMHKIIICPSGKE